MKTKFLAICIMVVIIFTSSLFAIKMELLFMPPEAKITLIEGQSSNKVSNPYKAKVKQGHYQIHVSCPGYVSQNIILSNQKTDVIIDAKLEKQYEGLELIAIYPVSGQPKSIVWLDNHRFVVNLLSGLGMELFDFTNHLGVISPASNYARQLGFVEGYVDESNRTYIQSQMTSASFHIYDLETLEYKESRFAEGNWTKVIAASSKYYFFSNWVSQTITVFDRYTLKYITKIKCAGVPRGIAITPDEKYMYTTIFDDALMQKIDMSSLKIVKDIRLSPSKGAARHIVLDKNTGLMYISDMGQAVVHKFDAKTDRILATTRVFSKPNTIVLSPDGHRLFVSCRGPNGPNGYMAKGLILGKLYVIDTPSMDVEEWIWGLNQPTGLDISPDGKYLVLGDFLDHKIELYRVKTGLIRKSYDQ